ncbi:DUF2512 family protein [Brevibacillus sp. SIMBA_040]|uniref:DUF2512 family protein n=1 Tax=unclassified Brevibacillus TaxID=2684853 RepID=UPI00397DDF34
MITINRFLIKVIINGVIVVGSLLAFTNATWLSAIVTALGLTVIAYLIGDQLILRATNNVTATIADAVIAAVYLWAVASMLNWDLSFGELFVTVVLLGVAELFYHRYLGVNDTANPEKS